VLADLLNSIDGLKSDVVFGDSRTPVAKILKRAQTLEYRERCNVALTLNNPIELITHLLRLDGYAQTILLASPQCSNRELQRRQQFLDHCELITDHSAAQKFTQQTDVADCGKIATNPYDTTWVLATSGTTAVPRQVTHTFRSLTRTTKLGNGTAFTWGVLYDPYRFAGLQVILQGLLGNSSIIFPDLTQTIEEQLALLVKENVNALSATPTLWRKILMCGKSKELDLRTISLGGEIADDGILRALSSAYPNATIRHIYASTEAGTAISVNDVRAGFPSSFLSDPPDGVELKICNQTLFVKNEVAKPQYIDGSSPLVDEDGFVDTGDHVVLEGDRVYFRGRQNGVINVGGNKVFPEHVESILFSACNVSKPYCWAIGRG